MDIKYRLSKYYEKKKVTEKAGKVEFERKEAFNESCKEFLNEIVNPLVDKIIKAVQEHGDNAIFTEAEMKYTQYPNSCFEVQTKNGIKARIIIYGIYDGVGEIIVETIIWDNFDKPKPVSRKAINFSFISGREVIANKEVEEAIDLGLAHVYPV